MVILLKTATVADIIATVDFTNVSMLGIGRSEVNTDMTFLCANIYMVSLQIKLSLC